VISKSYTVLNPAGFHARPTKSFVKLASSFPCAVKVTKQGKTANGKSSLSMLTLGIVRYDEVTLETDGEHEEQALQQLGQLLVQIHE
jgi:phosphotransferase system HPr (HPr) family protein